MTTHNTVPSPLWYVEAFDFYDTHNGGFGDVSEPFPTEQTARAYAESQDDRHIALYKVENNVFAHVDDYTRYDADDRPLGWHSQVTPEQIEAYQQAKRDAWSQEQIDLEHSGKALVFVIYQEHSDFVHGTYPDRASAEQEVARIKAVYPTANPQVVVGENKPGIVWGRYFSYKLPDVHEPESAP